MSFGKTAVFSIWIASLVVACGSGGSSDDQNPPAAGPVTLVAFDRDGDLHSINQATGASTFVLDTFYDEGGGAVNVGRVSGALYNDVAGKIWLGLGGSGSPCEACVLALDVLTGEGVFVADGFTTAAQDGFPGVAMGPDNRIFVHQGDDTGLFEIHNTTGAATLVSDTTAGRAGNGMTYSLAGVLYLATGQTLYSIDTTTYDATELAPLTKSGFPTVEDGEIIALSTRPSDGVIFGIWKDGASSGGSTDIYLVTLDPMTGLMTYVGSMTENFDGLAFVPTSKLP